MTTKWHEDNTLWRDTQAWVFQPARWEAARADVEHIVELLDLRASAHILDLPCGVGIFSIPLAARGFKVTAVDLTPQYLDVGRAAANEAGVEIEWHQADMRTYSQPGCFDAVVNLFTSFGYFEDPRDEHKAASVFFDSLKPGGQLLIDIMGREVLARIFRERDWQTLADGSLVLEERRIEADWTWIHNRLILIREGRQLERQFKLRLYTANMLVDLLKDVGFSEVDVYGSYDGRPYDHAAPRLVVRARKR